MCSFILCRSSERASTGVLLKGPVEIIELKGDKTIVQTELQFRKKLFRETRHGKRLIMGDLKDVKKKLLAKGKGISHSGIYQRISQDAIYRGLHITPKHWFEVVLY